MRFKKPRTIYSYRPAVPAAAPTGTSDEEILLTANSIVLSTESRPDFVALYKRHLAELKPQGPVECDLVEEVVVYKGRRQRSATIETSILNVTMDRMAGKVRIALAQVARDESRQARACRRALRVLREIQAERHDGKNPGTLRIPSTEPCAGPDRRGAPEDSLSRREPEKHDSPNEPGEHLTPVVSIDSKPNPVDQALGLPTLRTSI